MKITLKQIAEASGVSISTVSRVLSGQTENIQPSTRQKVITAMSLLGVPLENIDLEGRLLIKKRRQYTEQDRKK